jgi:hypothetical protein
VFLIKKRSSNRKVKNGHLIFFENVDGDKKLSNYWFSEHEVEARLHELVINYYRKFNCLPMDIQEMALLFFTSSPVLSAEFPGYGSGKSLRWKKRKKNKKAISHYRSIVISESVTGMCESLKCETSSVRYVYEVLPVFYSRLLRYYGDLDASQRFSDQIIRPNFYDQLYGGTSANDS